MSASFRRIERRQPGQGGLLKKGVGGGSASIGPTVGTVTASAAAALRAPGTRPWINGQSLVSSGNRDLDGTCVLPTLHTRVGLPFLISIQSDPTIPPT